MIACADACLKISHMTNMLMVSFQERNFETFSHEINVYTAILNLLKLSCL